MDLENKIMADMKEAMKKKDMIALEALRAIKSEILLIKTAAAGAAVSSEKEIALLQKLVKQRKEAAEQFLANDRKELAEKEIAQAEVIQKFLPEQLSPEELEEKVKEIIAATGATTAKDMGKVMAEARKMLGGSVDGKNLADTVKKLLN